MAKDYVLNMIEQFVLTVAAIARTRKAAYYEQALEQVQQTSQKYLNSDILKFLEYTPDELLNHFKDGYNNLDTESCFYCAELLYELAMICEEKNNSEGAFRLKRMSLNLYTSAIPNDNQLQTQESMLKTDSIMNEIDDQYFSELVLENVLQYRKFRMGLRPVYQDD
ncbi:MAG: hypothetical protein H0W50_09570 [Parachlamydiaceae bacterium]|nr:hypothetical protein [Parachlamydiaceae bacterium]